MKVHIWKDERYPDYGITLDAKHPNAEIDEELYKWYLAADREYNEMQQALKEAVQKGLGKP